jgi:hypothetical protein
MTSAMTSTPVSDVVADADRQALVRLVIEAAWRLDHGPAETFGELFTEDAILDVATSELRGRDAISAWAVGLTSSFSPIRHAVSNMRFIRSGDDSADGVTLVTIYLGDGSVPWSVGEEHDHFIRTSDGWRLAARQFVPLFARP